MRVPAALVSTPLNWIHSLMCASLRLREENRRPLDDLATKGEKLVFCLWHDELFPLIRVKRDLPIVTVVSPSYDGELLARVMHKQGVRTVRGSSSRGGAGALLGAAKMMDREGIHACVTVDGPRGPRHKAKTGALFLAQHTGAYVVPLRAIMEKPYCFGSWDRFQLPLPFSHVLVRFGQPWKLPDANHNDNDTLLHEAKIRLEAELTALAPERPEADTTMAHPTPKEGRA